MRDIDASFLQHAAMLRLTDSLYSLPYRTQHFSTQAGTARVLIRHQPLRGGQDRHTYATFNSRDVFDSDVHTATRLAHSLHTSDHGLPFFHIPQLYFQNSVSIRDIRLDALNVSFVLENSEDLTLKTRGGNAHDIMTPAQPVL
jgi:hypothetical protein